jgi:hypothetical protein
MTMAFACCFGQKNIKQKNKRMTAQDFTTTILVDETPAVAFNAINNVRGWWSEEIEGSTDKLNAVFNYHYEDVHRCQMKIIELVPNKKVVWLVEDNYFKFTKDTTEWKGTTIVFDIDTTNGKTQVKLTHVGLVPEYECFSICRDAWTNYIQKSLRNLITTGKGQPNGKGKPQTENEKRLAEEQENYTASFMVNATAEKVYNSINQVATWWTGDLEGNPTKLNDEFTVHFADIHVSTQKVIVLVPNKKVVWLVTKSNLNFLKDKQEWNGTRISFEITEQANGTKVTFTHFGLVPQIECYKDCTKGWDYFFKGSLFKLLTEGKGTPGLM